MHSTIPCQALSAPVPAITLTLPQMSEAWRRNADITEIEAVWAGHTRSGDKRGIAVRHHTVKNNIVMADINSGSHYIYNLTIQQARDLATVLNFYAMEAEKYNTNDYL